MDEIDDSFVSVGFTTRKKKGHNQPNYKLDIDPLKNYNKKTLVDPKDEHFMRRQGYVDKKKNYSTDVKDGIMTLKDFVKAQEYAHSAKEKYIAKRKK